MKFTKKIWPDILNYTLANLGLIGLDVTLFLQLSGNFHFFSWLVLIICIASIIFSIFVIKDKYTEIKKKDDEFQIFERDKFFDFIDKERLNARSSIINIVGDMSWIDQEKEKIEQLINTTNNLSMIFYYDPDVTESKQKIIDEYKRMGAKMIPYPVSGGADIKLMVIDIETEESSKMYGIERCNESGFQGFKVHIFDNYTYPIKMAKEFLRFLPLLKRTIVIGISGINNIGKTTLIGEIKRQLNNKVVVIDDPWVDIEKPKDTTSTDEKRIYSRNVALACLHKQLFDFLQVFFANADKKVIIFDRTPLDNCVFLDYNTTHDFPNIGAIRTSTKEFTKYLDLIIELKPDGNFRYNDTTYLKTDERKKIKKNISKRYVGHPNRKEYMIEFDEENFESKLSVIADEVVTFVNSKSIHPIHRF
jgi:hypothetical protein